MIHLFFYCTEHCTKKKVWWGTSAKEQETDRGKEGEGGRARMTGGNKGGKTKVS